MRTMILGGLALLALGGCNTVAGVGRDISAAGRGVEGAADYVQRQFTGNAPQPSTYDMPRQTRYMNGQVSYGQPCDPSELAGGPTGQALPPCRQAAITYSRPVQRDNR